MKLGIIDIGTNSFKLLIVTIKKDTYEVVHKDKLSVKLGEGGIKGGFIAHSPFLRGINALKAHKKMLDLHEVDKVIAFATAAIRDAENGKEFIKKVKQETDIDITIISGDKEASLIYDGVKSCVPMTEEKVLVIDIGGGSTEFIICNKSRIIWKKSFQLGAARLLEEINPSEPITKEEKEKFKQYIKTALNELVPIIKEHKIQTIIGSSGTFDSLAEMIYYKYETPAGVKAKKYDPKNDYIFDKEHLDELLKGIIKSNIDERMDMKGLATMRVEMIVMSSLLIKHIIKRLGIKTVRLSNYSLKEGMLVDYIRHIKLNKEYALS